MLGVCYRYARNREDAEDMMQEGFIKVFLKFTSSEAGALEGWIRRIIVHTCINVLKKNKKFTDSVDLIHASVCISTKIIFLRCCRQTGGGMYKIIADWIQNCIESLCN